VEILERPGRDVPDRRVVCERLLGAQRLCEDGCQYLDRLEPGRGNVSLPQALESHHGSPHVADVAARAHLARVQVDSVLRASCWVAIIAWGPGPQAPHGSEDETWKIVASGSAASDSSRTASVFATSGNDS